MAYGNDADLIRAAQARYWRGEKDALADIFAASLRIARGMASRQAETRRLPLSAEQIEEKAWDAATCVAEQYLRRPGFVMESPQGYVRVWVMNALYCRRKVEAIVKFVPREELERLAAGEET